MSLIPGSSRQWAIGIITVPLTLLLGFSIFNYDQVWAPFAPLISWWHICIGLLLALAIALLAWHAFRKPRGEDEWQEVERKAEVATAFIFSFVAIAFIVASIVLFLVSDDITKRPDLVAILFTGGTATIAILAQMVLENRRQRMERKDAAKAAEDEADKLREERKEADLRQRRAYTHKVLQEQRTDDVMQSHRTNVLHEFPGTSRIKDEDLPRLYAYSINPAAYTHHGSGAADVPVTFSISEILNFYEQIAADLHHEHLGKADGGSIDENLLRNTIAPAMHNLFRKALVQIKVQWRHDKQTYEHLRWLINRWQIEDTGSKQADGAAEEDGRAKSRAASVGSVNEVPFAVPDWKPEVWSEDGPDELITYPRFDGTSAIIDGLCWGEAAYMEMTLRGLKDWNDENTIIPLIEKTQQTFSRIPGFEDVAKENLAGEGDWTGYDAWAQQRMETAKNRIAVQRKDGSDD